MKNSVIVFNKTLLIFLTLFLSSCDPRFDTQFSINNLCKGVFCGINSFCIEKNGKGSCICNEGYLEVENNLDGVTFYTCCSKGYIGIDCNECDEDYHNIGGKCIHPDASNISWCNTDKPIVIINNRQIIYGQVYINGITSLSGEQEDIEAQLCYYAEGETFADSTCFDATYFSEDGENDIYAAQINFSSDPTEFNNNLSYYYYYQFRKNNREEFLPCDINNPNEINGTFYFENLNYLGNTGETSFNDCYDLHFLSPTTNDAELNQYSFTSNINIGPVGAHNSAPSGLLTFLELNSQFHSSKRISDYGSTNFSEVSLQLGLNILTLIYYPTEDEYCEESVIVYYYDD